MPVKPAALTRASTTASNSARVRYRRRPRPPSGNSPSLTRCAVSFSRARLSVQQFLAPKGLTTYQQDPFAPLMALPSCRVGPVLFPFVGVHLSQQAHLPALGVAFFQALPPLSPRQRVFYPASNLTCCPGRIQPTQVMTALRAQVPACLQGSHLGVADDQHIALAQDGDRRFVGRDVQRVISTVAGQGLAAQRQAQWVEGSQHGLELRQIWSVVFAVATLQQLARRTEVVVDADRAAVEADGVGGQAVDADPLLREIAIKGGLSSGSAKHGQQVSKPVIGAVGRA